MPNDPLIGLLKSGLRIDIPGGESETAVRRLAVLGLVGLQESTYVRCVNPLDHDQQHLKDRSCDGRIVLRANWDEDDHAYRCPDCGRVVFPSRKRRYRMLRVDPVEKEIRGVVCRSLDRLKTEYRERPTGLYVIAGRTGEVHVCLVDYCVDRAVLSPTDSRHDSVVFVVANDRDFRRMLPEQALCYRIIDLAIGEAASVFEREVRRLARLDDDRPVRPAVLSLGARDLLTGAPKTMGSSGVARLAVPPNTAWSQITIYMVDGETMAVRVPGSRLQRLTFRDLEMVDGRSGEPNKQWRLIRWVCDGRGERDWRAFECRTFDAFKTLVSTTRPILQRVLGIPADPFLECSQSGLRAAFTALPEAPEELYVGIDIRGKAET
jgi:hypothetical protein